MAMRHYPRYVRAQSTSTRPQADNTARVGLIFHGVVLLAVVAAAALTPAVAQTRDAAPPAAAAIPATRQAVPDAPGPASGESRSAAPQTLNVALHVKRIGTGEAFSCAVANDRSIRCWGRNYAAGSSPTVSEAPWTVAGIADATSIAIGEFSGCAIRTSGSVRCWGSNANSRLGYPAGASPTDVAGIGSIRDVSVGSTGACALDRSGSVWCWGANDTGQLGNGSTSQTSSSEPVLANAIPDAVRIASGRGTNCAVASSGALYCWGNGAQGQLGAGVTSSAVPLAIAGIVDVRDVSIGDTHVCAVQGNGHVACWGTNGFGELGDGTQVSRPTPLDAIGITTATDVTAGSNTSCALLADATAACWGTNRYGELGIAQQGDRTLPTAAVAAGLREIRVGHAEAFGSHTCALRSDDRVLCWGSDAFGRLGTFTPQFVATPATVEGLSDAVRIYGDEETICAQRTTGAVVCWGRYPGDGPGLAAVPFVVPNLVNTTAIDAGKFHACASTATAVVVCWGSGSMGQFGNGSLAFAATPTATAFSSGVQKVVVLLGHTCALFLNGSVQCVGGFIPNTQGPTTTITAGGAIDADGYGNVGCIILSARTVSCWQAGAATLTPQAGVSDAVELAVGWNHVCARISDGSVRCWGGDTSGQHGDGSHATTIGTGLETTSVSGLTDAIALAAGPDHTCAVRANGHVVCWGANGSRQLAFEPSLPGFSFSDVPFEVPGLADATGVAAGGGSYFGDWSCARRAGGTVSCWGAAGGGALGRTGVGFLDRPGLGPDLT